MPINLLPDEEKLKIKNFKRQEVTHIELMGPVKAEKIRPAVKQSGVLMFFKQAFQRPSAESKKEKIFPQKKIYIRKEIIREPIAPAPVRKEVKLYTTKPESMRMDSRESLWQKFWKFISGIFSRKRNIQAKPEKKYFGQYPEDQFPKYKPVRSEKIFKPSDIKPRRGEIINITTEYVKNGSGESDTKPQSQIVQPASEPAPFILPVRKTYPPAKEEVIKVEEKLKPIELIKPSIHSKPEIKKLVEKKIKRPSKLAVWWKSLLESIKKIFTFKRQPKNEKEAKKAAASVLPKPEAIKKELPSFELIPPPPAPAVQIKKEKPGKLQGPSKFSIWLKKIWGKLTGIFAGKKKAIPSEAMVSEVKSEIVPEPAPKERKPLDKIDLLHPSEAGPATFIKEKPEEKIANTIPPPPPPKSGKDGMNMTEPRTEPATNENMEWEVNLIPEDAVEVKVLASRWLYLALFIIIAFGLSFGGWVWSDWYKNNITAQIGDVKQKIFEADARIKQYDQLLQNVQSLNQDIQDTTTLMSQHIYWSKLFEILEEYTTPDVYYTNMTADVNGYIKLSAAGKDYDSAIKQLMIYEQAKDVIKAATVSNIVFSDNLGQAAEEGAENSNVEKPVLFNAELMIDPTIYLFPR
ncbi:MAG: hypothetical protein WCV50_03695 [Patescibacteria group bacterium]|jgi:hypothetical protein